MIYLDTSLIVKCYLNEPGSQAVLNWLAGRRGLMCSQHGRVEFCATLNRHVREQHLDARQAGSVLNRLAEDEHAGLWRWLPVTDAVLRRACQVLSTWSSGLVVRSADAIHLACAAEYGSPTVYTHDVAMRHAAPHFGLRAVDLLRPGGAHL